MQFKKLEKMLAVSALSLGLSLGFMVDAHAMVGGKPVIGISWKINTQDYAAFKRIIELAGGVPVELGQIKSQSVAYDKDGAVAPADLEPSGMLKHKYAVKIKDKNFAKTNVTEVMQGVDGVFGTGGEDISPSLYKDEEKELNHNETINAARDISDYTLQAYCLAKDIPTLDVCRSEQMLGVVSGAKMIQDMTDYYAGKDKVYEGTFHRMPPGVPNRTYARHDVHILPVNSYLRAIVGSDELKNVSSWHHQAIESIAGTDLVQTAETTHKGVSIIEGVENPHKTFMVALQFHPENDLKQVLINKKDPKDFCDTKISLDFFKALVKAAKDKALQATK